MAHQSVPSSFNELHTAFVTTENGTTLSELVQILGCFSVTPLLIPLLIPWIVPPSFAKQAVHDKDFFFLIKAIVEYPVLAVFPVWAVTLFAGQKDDPNHYIKGSGVVVLALIFAALGIIILNHSVSAPRWLGLRQHWMKIRDLPTGWITSGGNSSAEASQGARKLLFITNYRAITIYITILCILAVDFSIFPRRFSKTKTYGISLMDVGTGCFVFANGIVAPEARNKRSPLSKSLKSTIPIFILGFARLISVKGIEYQEVVEEYGVHWNFFFTLAAVKIFSSLLFTFFDASKSLTLTCIIGVLYEVLLNCNDFQNQYLLNPNISRSGNLVNANREGLFSTLGYLAVYMASVYVGKLVYYKIRISVFDWAAFTFQSFLQIMITWCFYALVTYYGNPTCRRTANLGYILLMIALNYSLLWFQMFLALVQVCLQHLGLIYGPIIFYELAELQKKEAQRIHALQKMATDSSSNKPRKRTSNIESEDIDRKLRFLEERLEEAMHQIKQRAIDLSNDDLLDRILSIENEISELEGKMAVDNSDSDIDNKETTERKRKLVLMPDLSKSPVILESICYNGLAVFLLGNLLTGLINCTIYTMYAPPYLSLCYLWFYVTLISAFSVTLFWYKIQLKFW